MSFIFLYRPHTEGQTLTIVSFQLFRYREKVVLQINFGKLFGGSGTPRVRTMQFFYLDILPNAIVLRCFCPMRCRVAELVPHFTSYAPRTALYVLPLVHSSTTQCVCFGFELLRLFSPGSSDNSGFFTKSW